MEIGPFSIKDVENIRELLEDREIAFEILVDQEPDAEASAEPGNLDSKIVYFEIPDEAYEKIKASLEKFGVIEQSDGSYELGEAEER